MSNIRKLLISDELDSLGSPTTLQYVIATHQRTKSSLLCKWLWNHGSFGLPWEYHYDPTEKFGSYTHPHNPMMHILDYEKVHQYRTGKNGVFGLKTMECVLPVFPMPDTKFYIYLDRKDFIARAISEYICDLSGQFWSIDDAGIIPEYNPDIIEMKINGYMSEKAEWQRFFQKEQIEPLILFSEDLHEGNTLLQIAEYLGINPEKKYRNPPFPDIQEQGRTTIIQEYKERFLKEAR